MARTLDPRLADPRLLRLAAMRAKHRRLHPPPKPIHQRSPEDQTLYDACRSDVKRFAQEFFPHL